MSAAYTSELFYDGKLRYSLNRLNVATSRAKCASILVGSPQIFEVECRTPRQIQLANAFCRYLEMAKCISFG